MFQAVRRLWGSDPPPELKQKLKPDWSWTPDQVFLEQFQRQLMFVADDLKRGGKNHDVLMDICPIGSPINPYVYTHNKYLAYKQDLGRDPETKRDLSTAIVMPADYNPTGHLFQPPDPAPVQGELYALDSFRIYLLDKHMQNGVKYARIRTRITYPFREADNYRTNNPKISPHCFTTITAWMYVGIPSYWDPMIGGVMAKPIQLHKHDEPRHYVGEFYKLDFTST